MTRPARRLHLAIWLVLAGVVAVAAYGVQASSQAWPVETYVPPQDPV